MGRGGKDSRESNECIHQLRVASQTNATLAAAIAFSSSEFARTDRVIKPLCAAIEIRWTTATVPLTTRPAAKTNLGECPCTACIAKDATAKVNGKTYCA